MNEQHAVVVGAGPAGIAMAISLQDRGIRPLVVDRASEVASSWRTRYDRLKLNTGRQFSHLPGRPYPKGTPTFPSRDEVVEHLDRHAREAGVSLRLNTTVNRIERRPSGWTLRTSGDDIDARHVVVATGMTHTPRIPKWPGEYTGEVLHSSQYRNPAQFAGRRVLVVGSGSSGMEIAHDLATGGAAKVWLAVRTPPNIMRRAGPGGLPGDVLAVPLYHLPPRLADRIAVIGRRKMFGDLSEFGLPIPAEGPFTRGQRLHVAPSLVDPEVIEAIRDGLIEVVSAVTGFEGEQAVLADDSRLTVDTIVAATGYHPGLEPLVGHLGVLRPDGLPIAQAPVPAADGLYFHGLTSRPALIGYVSKQSRRLAKKIANP